MGSQSSGEVQFSRGARWQIGLLVGQKMLCCACSSSCESAPSAVADCARSGWAMAFAQQSCAAVMLSAWLSCIVARERKLETAFKEFCFKPVCFRLSRDYVWDIRTLT